MRFNKYFTNLTAEEKRELASRADTSVAYLCQISNGYRNAGFSTIQNLIKADSNIIYEMFESAA